jgi:hypothetical protein
MLCAFSVSSVLESSITKTGSAATAAARATTLCNTEDTEKAQRATEIVLDIGLSSP